MKTSDSPNPETDPLRSWLEAKRALRPSSTLADSVMTVIAAPSVALHPATGVKDVGLSWWQTLFGSVWARAAVLLLATTGGLGRVVLVLAWLLRS